MAILPRLEPLTDPIGSAEHGAWLEQSRALQKAYRAKRRAWCKAAEWPWPARKPVDIRPHPGLIDDDVPEG